MIEGTINVGLSVPNQPQLSEVIRYLESHRYLISGGIAELSKDMNRPQDKRIFDHAEEELAIACHEYECLGVAIQTLKGLA